MFCMKGTKYGTSIGNGLDWFNHSRETFWHLYP